MGHRAGAGNQDRGRTGSVAHPTATGFQPAADPAAQGARPECDRRGLHQDAEPSGGRADRGLRQLCAWPVASEGRPRRNRTRDHEPLVKRQRCHAAGRHTTVETANLTLAGTDVSVEDLSPGRYVTMAVHDTGVGIDAEMQAHIFEPFFTTKEAGKGTGLGLATVLGIVEQSGGVIRCESEPGRGTSFKIFLPAVGEALDKGASPAGSLGKAPRGSEVVLLVEDEDAVRKLARIILEVSGYVVLDARNGREGLALCETHHGPIDLLVTDVMMPELGGRELAEGAIKLRPGLKVMFMSGHTEDTVLKEGVQKGTAFLQKPFTPARLAQKVRETLDSADKSAGQP